MAVNPFGFTKGPVTFWLIVVYAAFLIPLVWIHETVPNVKPTDGLNVTEAWQDLTTITRQYHPYNSRANDEVGNFLLKRIEEILNRNGVEWTKEKDAGGIVRTKALVETSTSPVGKIASQGPRVTVFDDTISNISYNGRETGYYFESTNKLVYIRGTEDEDGEWWKRDEGRKIGKGGVLVNAHYDSVSTGYGATDDGMGCVSILQMLDYYTKNVTGRQPKRGIVLLLNNGEEDGLYGAMAYVQSPLYYFTTTFVNLEGAGAGGRAILFRATDLEVVKAYNHAPHPFGSVVAFDGFKLGIIRSATDYSIWNENFGQRGLDIAFYRPRARYHTNQDDTRHASRESMWHMLTNSLAAVDYLQKDTSSFTGGSPAEGDKRKVSSGRPTEGAWFDMFGQGFASLELRGLFAWALTLLIVTPLILVLVSYLLSRNDKYYYFSRNAKVDADDASISLGGWKGFFRIPLAFVFSAGLTFAAALLTHKVNPEIIYSSEYVVWANFLSLFFISFWLISKGASSMRPSGLQRGYAHIWLFVLSWTLLVAATILIDRFKIAGVYPLAFFHSAVFVATLISLLDLFALPAKKNFAEAAHHDQQNRDDIAEVPNSDALISPAPSETASRAPAEEQTGEPTETSALLGGENENHGTIRQTFTSGYRRSNAATADSDSDLKAKKDAQSPHEKEQPWAAKLPSWTWIVQLLLMAPINVVIISQIALFVTSAINQTGADGVDSLWSYLILALFSVFILLPVIPFIHRVTYHLPVLLVFIFVITLVYNLVAFPFSSESRLKVRFQQLVDLQEESSIVRITGIEKHVQEMIKELPSAVGQDIQCRRPSGLDPRLGTYECRYDAGALLPKITGSLFNDLAKNKYADLINFNVSRSKSSNYKATIDIDAKRSKNCVLSFDDEVSDWHVHGNAGTESILGKPEGSPVTNIVLWRRDWSKPWTVDLEWAKGGPKVIAASSPSADSPTSAVGPDTHEELRLRQTDGPLSDLPRLRGKISCAWSDANVLGTIPAFDEALQYAPEWIAVTKNAAALVEGYQSIKI
ncbi:Vacuolar membrane protease [Colletotrichum siamense]|uniref:Vacuolar membrane protease n=1 Tax=Colletotrichum siamense TaxID=690259 RepID=UPI0018729603|nr:Vacuolar membrane protease [Colletotrichum siamense]KAF5497001.1 Vacuolar membrane protease [Colletotrichum siamense]